MLPREQILLRHPEVPARSAGLEGCTASQVGYSRLGQFKLSISGKPEIDAVALRGSLRSHLRVTDYFFESLA
jgi:hypothetical protein